VKAFFKSPCWSALEQNNQTLLAQFESLNYSSSKIAPLVEPFFITIVTSLKKSGYIPKESTLNLEEILDWMKASKEWHHWKSCQAQTPNSHNFSFAYFFSRALFRFLDEKPSHCTRLEAHRKKQNDSIHFISEGILDELGRLSYKLHNQEQSILALYFEGITIKELSQIFNLPTKQIDHCIKESKSFLKKNLEIESRDKAK
jgi:DNA-directed RNA polymerase specialized sigma24 family protein